MQRIFASPYTHLSFPVINLHTVGIGNWVFTILLYCQAFLLYRAHNARSLLWPMYAIKNTFWKVWILKDFISYSIGREVWKKRTWFIFWYFNYICRKWVWNERKGHDLHIKIETETSPGVVVLVTRRTIFLQVMATRASRCIGR